MKKSEYIRKHGIQAYLQYLERERERCKEKRKDINFRLSEAARRRQYHQDNYIHHPKKKDKMLIANYERVRKILKYVRKEDFEKIENYEKALKDDFRYWYID